MGDLIEHIGTLAQAWSQPAAWDGTTRIAAMDTPADMVGVTLADELVVPGWDLAQATGQPFQPEPAAVRAARSFPGLVWSQHSLARFASLTPGKIAGTQTGTIGTTPPREDRRR